MYKQLTFLNILLNIFSPSFSACSSINCSICANDNCTKCNSLYYLYDNASCLLDC